MKPSRFAVAKEGLQNSLSTLLAELVPGGHEQNGIYTGLNPTRADRSPGSFVIWTRGESRGCWTEYSPAAPGKGDVVDLVAYVLGCSRFEALRWAENWLGIDPTANRLDNAAWRATLEARAAEAAARKAADAERQRQERDDKAQSAKGWWLAAEPGAGSPAQTYLEARGLRLARWPGALRFQAAAKYRHEDGTISLHPVMLAAMSDKGGAIRAVHRTFLRADGAGKADVPSAKKMWGDPAGATIRLSKGRSSLSPEAAAERIAGLDLDEAEAKGLFGPLAIAEGIENALSFALWEPDFRVWAAGSIGNLARIAWPVCASRVVLVADNDPEDNPEAQAGFQRASAHWLAQSRGRPVEIWRPPAGVKDANDLLRAMVAREARAGAAPATGAST